jgi:hypothetical protein
MYIGPESKPDPNKTPPSKTSDCGVKGEGYVIGSTGAITCVPASDSPSTAPTVSSNKPSESGKPGADGKPDPNSLDYKKSDKESSTKGGETTTKEKETTNPDVGKNGSVNGGCPVGASIIDGKCVETKTTIEPTGDFCTKNPNATACKGFKDECLENPDRASCKSLGDVTTEGAVTAKPIGTSMIEVVGFSSNSSCPADIQLPKGAHLSFEWPCNLASTLKPIILALAWLSAGLIVMGAFKGS